MRGAAWHRFRVVARITASQLDDTGMAYDFTRLKQHLGDILSRFDHVCLNDVPPFGEINPSSENIAAYIFEKLSSTLNNN